MEMKNKQINHARNLWDRAITIMPRTNQFWYKYTYMEEMLENVAGARQVFERWMDWQPEEQAWQTYINFELRYKELERARGIYERFVMVHPEVKNWIKYSRFEESHGFLNGSRTVYERAIEFFGEEYIDERLYIAFARFEENQREHDRARVIYKYALDHLSKEKSLEIYKAYSIHEKKFGDKAGIEDVIASKRKFQYEKEIAENPTNYDAWFDYIRLIEHEGNVEVTRETYERAIANVPPANDKNFWRRYIYLWINYAIFEELEMEDMERTRQIYKTLLELIPHKVFTFSKFWLYYAQFEIRQKNLLVARKALGMAIGICPRDKIYRGYIELEIQLREFDRCRILYEKFLEFNAENCITWMKFAELETLLGDVERARAIYELAVSQPRLDMPELLWKSFIDFEVAQGEIELARQLYERLLDRTGHVKVWISYAKFELTSETSEEGLNVSLARRVYERGNECQRNLNDREARVLLLEGWRDFEKENGDAVSNEKVLEKMPRRVKKRQKIVSETGETEGWEEVFDYIFPEDEMAKPNLKLLAAAKNWKKVKEVEPEHPAEQEERDEADSDSESGSGSSSDSEKGESKDDKKDDDE